MKTKNKSIFTSKIKELEKQEQQADKNFFPENALADSYSINSTNTKSNSVSVPNPVNPENINDDWFQANSDSYDGQLAVDVYQDKKNIYVKAAIAGVKPVDIDIDLNNDMVTIKGKRSHCHENIDEDDYYIKECYWGGFSRSIILPVDIKSDQVKASIEHGMLTITLPKSERPRNTKIKIQEVKN